MKAGVAMSDYLKASGVLGGFYVNKEQMPDFTPMRLIPSQNT
jgi:hypothetical protein